MRLVIGSVFIDRVTDPSMRKKAWKGFPRVYGVKPERLDAILEKFWRLWENVVFK